jgi:hypothetical protein
VSADVYGGDVNCPGTTATLAVQAKCSKRSPSASAHRLRLRLASSRHRLSLCVLDAAVPWDDDLTGDVVDRNIHLWLGGEQMVSSHCKLYTYICYIHLGFSLRILSIYLRLLSISLRLWWSNKRIQTLGDSGTAR